jgi:hypothetical protein
METQSEKTESFVYLALIFFLLESILAGRLPKQMSRLISQSRRGTVIAFLVLMSLTIPAWSFGEMSVIRVAQVQYDGGNWRPYARPLKYLMEKMVTMTNVEPSAFVDTVSLQSPKLFDYPFLYWAGDRGFPQISEEHLSRLRTFLSLGGFIFFDDATSRANSAFHQSVKRLTKRLFPSRIATAVDDDHAVFRSYYLLTSAFGRSADGNVVEHVRINQRSVLTYFSGDLGGALAQNANGEFVNVLPQGIIQRRYALRFGVNVLYYVLTLDYKQDQIHLPFILKRRGS